MFSGHGGQWVHVGCISGAIGLRPGGWPGCIVFHNNMLLVQEQQQAQS